MSSILRSKLFAYGVVSTGVAAALVSHVYNQRQNFYSAAVQMHRSTGSAIILGNFAAFLCILAGYLFKAIFFGTLRTIEVEHFYDKSWFFVTESMLALTFFRDDFNPPFIALFAVLYFLRSFHWIAGDRIDYMEQIPSPGPSKLFHLRMIASLAFFLFWDILSTYVCLSSLILDKDAIKRGTALGGLGGSSILFAAEFAITLARGINITAKYIVNVIDIWRARGQEDTPAWEGKSMCVSFIDLLHDALRLVIYAIFFYTIFTLYGSIPLNHIHSLYSAVRSFSARIRDLLKYRMATKNMDAKYPDATEEDIRGMGGESCVICREEMVPGSGRVPGRREGPNDTPKKLGCGHVFHFHCLRSWLERQQSCPTCRRTVLAPARPSGPTQPAAGGQPPAPAPGAVPGAPGAARPTATVSGVQLPTGTARSAADLPGAKCPPNGPLGLWPTSFGVAPQRRWPGTQTTQFASLGAGTSVPGTPVPAATPLSSQAPQVFRPLGGPRANSTSGSSTETRTNPLLPQFSTTRDDLSTQNQTPAQLAAAAAMRRLAKMAKDQRSVSNTTRESATSEPSFFNVPAKSKKPQLVPAFTSKTTPGMSFSVPMPAFPATGPSASAPATASDPTAPAAPLSVEEQIANLKKHITELQQSLIRNEDNTPARLEELYRLHELIGNVANRSTMAFSASVGGPGPSGGQGTGTVSTQRSPSQSPPPNDLSPVTSEPDDTDQDADVDPDAMVID